MNFSISARQAGPRRPDVYNPRAVLASRPARLSWEEWGMISAAVAVASAVFLIVWLV